METEREFDLMIYGADGFSARRIVEHFAGETAGLECLGHPVYRCEIKDLHSVAARAVLLVNCVGPFMFTGEAVIEECLRAGTHYMDISGESCFLELVITKYHEVALSRGLFVINSCGFDAVVADVGVMRLKRHFDSVQVEGVFSATNLVVSATGFESVVAVAQNQRRTLAMH